MRNRSALGLFGAAVALGVAGCQSPPYRPRILSVQTPNGMPAAAPLNGRRTAPLIVPTAPVGGPAAVPVTPVVPVQPGITVPVTPEPPPGAFGPGVSNAPPAPVDGVIATSPAQYPSSVVRVPPSELKQPHRLPPVTGGGE